MLKKTWKILAIALLIVIFLRYKFGPEFFDLFGLIIFLALIFVGLWELYSKKQMPDWLAFGLIVVGLFGLVVDGITSFELLKSWILGGLK